MHYDEYYFCKYSVSPCPPSKEDFLVLWVYGQIKSITTVTSECITVYCWCKSVKEKKKIILSPLPYFTLPIKWCISGRYFSGGYFWLMSVC